MSRRRVPPRPDVAAPRRPVDPTVWIVAVVLSLGVVASVAIVATAPSRPIAPAQAGPSRAPGQAVEDPSVPTSPDGPYAFLEATYVDGRRMPVRWDPCQPIEYVVNTQAAPPGTDSTIAAAISQASNATGIAFHSDGATTRDVHSLVTRGYFVDPLRSIYRPVLIDVVTHREFRSFHEPRRVVAFAHPQTGSRELAHQYVAGFVVVDGGFRYAVSGRWSMALVIQHELGHLLGLAHVRAPDELMFSSQVARHTIPSPIQGWGPGDLEGLERLGTDQGCLPQVRVAG